MVFPIVGGTQSADYEISNAATFWSNTSLTREFDQDPTGNRKTFTISCWVKRGNLSSNHAVVSASTTNNFNDKIIGFRGDTDGIEVNNVASGSDAIQIITNRKFRDVSAWYHIVVAIDTTQSSLADGVKFYVNGVRDTDFSGTPVYNQNATFEIGRSGSTTAIGKMQVNDTQYYDGYISEFFFIDGQQLDPTYFGETNDNGVWIPKDYTGTYGNNGFRLEFKQTGTSQNSSGIGADTSGNDQHFASNNLASWVIGEDTPTNNFCTLNPLAVNASNVLSSARGNTQVFDTNNGNFRIMGSTMPFTKGKWYVECKFSGGTNDTIFGFLDVDNRFANQYNYTTSGSWPGYISSGNSFGYRENGTLYTNGNETTGKTTWSSNGDFLGLAIDADNNATYAHVNGTYVDSGDPTSGASKTGSLSNFTQTGAIMIAVSVKASSYNGAYINFGNPVNNDSGVTNSNSDANGIGQFQYSVPSGYFAICSKNLAEFG